MSAVLGKIHYQLFNRIKIIDQRNEFLIKKLTDKNEDMIFYFNQIIEKFNGLIGNQSLEKLLGEKHIHPGLEELIIKVQSMEANLIEKAVNEGIAFDYLIKKYFEHGRLTVEKRNLKSHDLEDTAKNMLKIFLERMPCDRYSKMEIKDNEIHFIRRKKLHTEFWNDIDIPNNKMHKLYESWIRGALSEMNPMIKYRREVFDNLYIDKIIH